MAGETSVGEPRGRLLRALDRRRDRPARRGAVLWVDLARFELAGSPVRTLDPDSLDLSGDVSAKFAQAVAPF